MNYAKLAQQSKASQDKFELWQLLEILGQIKPEKILEIGVHKGFSIETWRQAFPDALIVGIENDPQFLEFEDFELVQGDSHDPAIMGYIATQGQFDFLFIDGDHTYLGAKKDFELYSPLVRKGGLIAFHDTMRIGPKWAGNVEVRRLYDELSEHYPNIEIWNGPAGEGGPGTGIFFK